MTAPCGLGRGALLRRLAPYIDREVDARSGSRARDLLALGDAELAAAVGATADLLDLGTGAAPNLRGGESEGAGCWALCADRLPGGLADLGAAAPKALFGRGSAELIERLEPERAVAIVGSRRASSYGIEVATELGRTLAAAGLVVVSGMAFGVDSAAHRGALEAGGKTVAVLAAGPDRPYPRSRATLYRQIAATGAVISELPPDSPTFRWMFPARNRIIAALAGLTIVVEAAERSGSLITADMAVDLGRSVGAVPGPVTSARSAGTNRLLAQGATVIRDAQDALDALLGPGVLSAVSSGPPVEPERLRILDAVEAGANSPDAVAVTCAIDPIEAAMGMTVLELDGYLTSTTSGTYARTALALPEHAAGGSRLRSGP